MILVNADTVWMIRTITIIDREHREPYQIVHNSYLLFIIKLLLLTITITMVETALSEHYNHFYFII